MWHEILSSNEAAFRSVVASFLKCLQVLLTWPAVRMLGSKVSVTGIDSQGFFFFYFWPYIYLQQRSWPIITIDEKRGGDDSTLSPGWVE